MSSDGWPEGQPLTTVVATFTDSDPFGQTGVFQATVHWGDGQTSPGFVAQTEDGFEVRGTHTYIDDATYATSVEITDVVSGDSATAAGTIEVVEVPLQVNALPLRLAAGVPFTGVVATYGPAEPGGPLEFTIDWGDGSEPTAAEVAQTGVLGTHTYALPGSYEVTITADEDGVVTTVSTTAVVSLPPVEEGAGLAVSAVEDQVFSGAVATVTLPAGVDPGLFASTIYWGDQTSPTPGVLVPDGQGGYRVEGSHTYAAAGAYSVATSVGPSAFFGPVSFFGSALVLGAPLTGSVVPVTSTQGEQVSPIFATFHDVNPDTTAEDFRALVDLGNGLVGAGVVLEGEAPGDFVVRAFPPSQAGSYTFTVTVEDQHGRKLVLANGPGTVAPYPLTVYASSPLTVGQETFNAVIGGFDADWFAVPDDFSASIAWGDGTTSQGVIPTPDEQAAYVGGPFALFTVLGEHRYDFGGDYTVTLTVHDTHGGTQSDSTTIHVGWGQPGNTMPDPYLSVSAQDISVQEGRVFSAAVGTVTNSEVDDPGDYLQAVVDWGDGPQDVDVDSASLQDNGDGTFTVLAEHAYLAEGTYAVKVYAWDPTDLTPQGGTYGLVVASATATVSDAPRTEGTVRASSVPLTATEGGELSGPVATFTCADTRLSAADFWPVIDWGGSLEVGEVTGGGGTFQVWSSSTSLMPGDYGVKVEIYTDVLLAATTYTSVHVEGLPPSVQGAEPLTAAPYEWLEQVTLARFTDASPYAYPEQYLALVSWGDGLGGQAEVSGSGGNFEVKGTHAYAAPGQYTVRVAIYEWDVLAAVVAVPIDVVATSPGPGPFFVEALRLAAVAGAPLNGVTVATFRDTSGAHPDPCCGYQVSIDWGDQSDPSAGVLRAVPGHPGEYEVLGSHTYAHAGAHPVVVYVSDEWGLWESGQSTALVDPPLVQVAGVPALSTGVADPAVLSNVGLSDVVVATFTVANPLAEAGDFLVSISWGDGAVSTGRVVWSGGRFVVLGSHAYQGAGSYRAWVWVDDLVSPPVAGSTVVVVHPATAGLPALVDPGTVQDDNPYSWLGQADVSWGDGAGATVFGWLGSGWITSPNGWGDRGRWWQWYDLNSAGWPAGSSWSGAWPRSAFPFAMRHVYAEAGNYTASVAARLSGDEGVAASAAVTVADAGLSVLGALPLLTGFAGTPVEATLARFSDDDPGGAVSDYTVSVDWGDGSVPTSASVGPAGDGTFTVQVGSPGTELEFAL